MILKFVLWYLNKKFLSNFNDIDEDKMNEWLLSCNSEHGFRDYFKMRDLILLKTMGNGILQKEYWMTVGRRTEILFLLAKAHEQLKKESNKDKR